MKQPCLPAILIPACASSSPAFLMMYSAYKLSKQGDNIQPWHTPFPIWNQSVVPYPVLTVASWPAYRVLKRQIRWSAILSSKLKLRPLGIFLPLTQPPPLFQWHNAFIWIRKLDCFWWEKPQGRVIKNQVFGSNLPAPALSLWKLLAEWPWASYIP